MKKNRDSDLNEKDDLQLQNVTLTGHGYQPILQSVDFELPLDQTIVIESSYPENAVAFLKFLAGQSQSHSGVLLWNGKEAFSEADEFSVASYFENFLLISDVTFHELWGFKTDQEEEFADLVEQFDLQQVYKTPLKKLDFSYQKLAFLVRAAKLESDFIVMEDPSYGLKEADWLNFLDFMQLRQRRGYLRHVYMTTSDAKAMTHLAHNKIYLEDGLIYFDQEAGFKKASHF